MEIKQNIFWQWISWQFFEMPGNILKAWRNFLNFGLYYFSTPILLKSLFSPWKRYYWVHPKGFDIGKYLEIIISNLFSRFLGAILRFFLIIIGLLVEIFLFFAGLSVFLGWFVLPVLLLMGLWFGIKIIF